MRRGLDKIQTNNGAQELTIHENVTVVAIKQDTKLLLMKVYVIISIGSAETETETETEDDLARAHAMSDIAHSDKQYHRS